MTLDLAAWQHERRVPKGLPGAGRWVKGSITGQLFRPVPAGEQETLPGMLPVSKAERVRQALEQGIRADNEFDTKPGEDVTFETPGNNYFGQTADTSIVSFDDGSTWVRKRSISEDSMHREIAYSRVSDVLGAGAPEVIEREDPQTGKPSIWMPYVDGQTGIEWTDGYDPDEAEADAGGTDYEVYDEYGGYVGQRENTSGHEPDDMYNSDRGLLIGLADTITNTGDRHMGNWMVEHGEPVPIDNESARFGPGAGTANSPFADAFARLIEEDPHSLGDFARWSKWLAGLQGLEGEFDQMGMREEWQNLLLNFREVRGMVFT